MNLGVEDSEGQFNPKMYRSKLAEKEHVTNWPGLLAAKFFEEHLHASVQNNLHR